MDWDSHREEEEIPEIDIEGVANDINFTVNGGGSGSGSGSGVMYVKVMTDEQIETLRRQIAVYATICEQLVQMHKTLTSQQDLSQGNYNCDSAGGQRLSSRQRWTPTPVQLQILEHIFDQGNGTPTKQKIKEITNQLSQHGQISETNVYNWFQNRRARSKRKQQLGESSSNEVDSPKTKPENIYPTEDLCFRASDVASEMRMLSDPRDDRLNGEVGVGGNYNLYEHNQDYTMPG